MKVIVKDFTLTFCSTVAVVLVIGTMTIII